MSSIKKVVTVAGSPLVLYFDGYPGVNITFAAGEKYVFDQGDSSNGGHQIVFGVIPDDINNVLGAVDGVTISGTPGQTGAYTQLLLPSNFTGSLYYYCAVHPNMGPVTIDTHYYVKAVQNMVDDTVFALSTTESGTYYNQLDLSFNTDDKILFHISDSSMDGYNLIFGTELDNSATTIPSSYLTVTIETTETLLFLNLAGYNGSAVYYFEDTSANMGYTEQPTPSDEGKLYNPPDSSTPTDTSSPTASSVVQPSHFGRQIGGTINQGGWVGKTSETNMHWLSLDLTTVKSVLGVLIQPRFNSGWNRTEQFVETLEIEVSSDFTNWTTMTNTTSGATWDTGLYRNQLDPLGNSFSADSWKMALYFTTAVYTQYVRLNILTFTDNPALRFGVIYDHTIGGELSYSEDLGSYTTTYSQPTFIPIVKIVTISGSPEVFYLDGSANPDIAFAAGETYIFDHTLLTSMTNIQPHQMTNL